MRQPGRQRARQRGFTLIEVLLVVVLIGILMGVAVLSLNAGDGSRRLQQAQSALTGQLGYARLLAENEQQEIGVRLQAPGYRFLRFEPATRRWLPVRDDPVLKPQEWPDLAFSWRDSGEPVASPLSAAAAGPSGVSASRPAPERPDFVFLSSGEATPGELTISVRDGNALARRLQVSDLGDVRDPERLPTAGGQRGN